MSASLEQSRIDVLKAAAAAVAGHFTDVRTLLNGGN